MWVPDLLEIGRVGGDRLFVELDADAGKGRQRHMPVDDPQRLLDEAMAELLAGVDVLGDQEVGRAGGHLDDGRQRDRTVRVVGRHHHVAGFGHRGDLAHLEDAAGVAEVGLDHVDQPVPQQRPYFPTGVVALAGGELKVVKESGASEVMKWETGKAYWLDADPPGELHADVNETGKPIEVMVVEMRTK